MAAPIVFMLPLPESIDNLASPTASELVPINSEPYFEIRLESPVGVLVPWTLISPASEADPSPLISKVGVVFAP